jgi:cyclopropane fatty-acyl-phospholipid synthase-like methyltransferase
MGRGQEEVWDSLYASNPGAWRGNARIPVPCSGRALDVGCGNGKTVASLLDAGFEVSAVDFSAEAVRLVRERFGDKVTAAVSDAGSIPFGDGSFDYITAVHLCEHLTDDEMGRFASEVSRLLVPGGYVFIRSFGAADFRSAKRASSDITYIHRSHNDLAHFFEGFDIVSSGTIEERTRFGETRSREECLLRRTY